MKKHTKIYLDYFDYGHHPDVWIPCEFEHGKRCVDVHHLDPRRMGGSKEKDVIENLMGLCREHHTQCERDPEFNEHAKEIHLNFIKHFNG